jgi:hypothetical protein
VPLGSDVPQREGTPTRRASGADGNERLTAITGAVLLALFAVEGVTILKMNTLLYWHYYFGFLLIGPVCVKIGSTLYRFTRYYTYNPDYVRKGPPTPLLRVLGPFVVLSTVGVMGTGVALALVKTRSYEGINLLFLHKASFFLWGGVMAVHVLSYAWRLPALIGPDLWSSRAGRAAAVVGGRRLRWSVTVVSLGAGLVIAEAASHLEAAWHR